MSRLGVVTYALFLVLVLAPSPSFAAPGLTLRPLLGLFDPGGFYWGVAARGQYGATTMTILFRHNDFRGDEWRLSYERPLASPWVFRFDLAVNEKRDTFDIDRLPEVTLFLLPIRLGSSVSVTGEAGVGVLFERQSGVRTVRTRTAFTLLTDPVPLAGVPVDTSWIIASSWYTGAAPQHSAAVTIGTTIPLGSSFAFRAAYTRRWVDGLSPLGFDRLEALKEAAGTLSLRLTGTLTASATFVYGFFVRDVKDRDYALTYGPPGQVPISLIWHDVTQRWEMNFGQTF